MIEYQNEVFGARRVFQNKLVLITGGGGGVGFQCARSFAKLGANLLLVGRSSEKLAIAQKIVNEEFNVVVHSLSGDVEI